MPFHLGRQQFLSFGRQHGFSVLLPRREPPPQPPPPLQPPPPHGGLAGQHGGGIGLTVIKHMSRSLGGHELGQHTLI